MTEAEVRRQAPPPSASRWLTCNTSPAVRSFRRASLRPAAAHPPPDFCPAAQRAGDSVAALVPFPPAEQCRVAASPLAYYSPAAAQPSPRCGPAVAARPAGGRPAPALAPVLSCGAAPRHCAAASVAFCFAQGACRCTSPRRTRSLMECTATQSATSLTTTRSLSCSQLSRSAHRQR